MSVGSGGLPGTTKSSQNDELVARLRELMQNDERFITVKWLKKGAFLVACVRLF
jgi:hypothetical protein